MCPASLWTSPPSGTIGGPSASRGSAVAVASPVTPRLTVVALLLLTFATGLVDAISVLVLGHVFVANMTGNVIFLGF